MAPTLEMIAAILEFGEGWTGQRALVVSCFAGISRSTAAAYGLACQKAAPGREVEVAVELRARSPSATPNPLVVALMDEILGRKKRMIAAIQGIGRGAEAFEGEPFDLDILIGEVG